MVLLYDRTSSQESVNQARTQLFTQKGRAITMDFPHTSSTNTAHKEDCLPLLGTDDGCSFDFELPSPSDRGKRKDIGGWKLTGPHYQKLPRQAVNSSSVGVQQGKMQICQGITSMSALCHCGGLCSHN